MSEITKTKTGSIPVGTASPSNKLTPKNTTSKPQAGPPQGDPAFAFVDPSTGNVR